MPTYSVWAHCAYEKDPVSLPSGGLEKTTKTTTHRVAEHRPTRPKTSQPSLPKAVDMAQKRPLWRMMSTYGTTQS